MLVVGNCEGSNLSAAVIAAAERGLRGLRESRLVRWRGVSEWRTGERAEIS